jgi:hypothetical protein
MHSKQIEALQGQFRFEGDDRAGLVCVCFHGVLDGVTRGAGNLLCADAPWWCPKVDDRPTRENPRASNTGVSLENLDQTILG